MRISMIIATWCCVQVLATDNTVSQAATKIDFATDQYAPYVDVLPRNRPARSDRLAELEDSFLYEGAEGVGRNGVLARAIYVVGVTLVGLYLTWNCLQVWHHVKSERLLRATALRLCRCAPDHVARNTMHALFSYEQDDGRAAATALLLPLYSRNNK